MVRSSAERSVVPHARIHIGTYVVVRNRYVGTWSRGFKVAEEVDDGYLIRRVSDGAVLPEVIGHDEVRYDPRSLTASW